MKLSRTLVFAGYSVSVISNQINGFIEQKQNLGIKIEIVNVSFIKTDNRIEALLIYNVVSG